MRRRLIAAAAVSAVALAGAGLAANANAEGAESADPELSLAEPTGDSEVGVTSMHLTDDDRADPWVPEEKRELMLSVWYPAEDDDGETAPYMTEAESELFTQQFDIEVPADILNRVETNAHPDARPDADAGKAPLIVFSPGFSFPRATLTGLAEDLASRGYVVAAVGHNYEAPISFPDGRTTECKACESEDMEKVVKGRVDDLSFVLDTLTGDKAKWKGAGLIDTDRILAGGHSIGGASSYATMLADERVDAGFNMDGTFFLEGDKDLNRPFMMLGAAEHGEPGGDDTWDSTWPKLSGWKRWL
ncbi:MAG: alpha/beta hydrolase family protein, partial [Stackebrandtia sp.]